MGVSPIWVNLNRAAKFPEVERVYKRAGWGQGTGQGSTGQPQNGGAPTSAPRGFLTYVRKLVSATFSNGAALPSWLRKDPSSNNTDWQTVQVDVTNIPGVRPLNDNGKWQSFQA